MNVKRSVLALTFSTLMCLQYASAQATLTGASVTGRVIDPSGALVARAQITATRSATNEAFTLQSDPQGRFRFSYLPVGQYSINAQAPGFQNSKIQVDLTVGAAFDVTLRLPISSTASVIQVSDTAPVIELNRSQIAETISQTETTSLPFEGRNYLDVALLLPGISPTNTASTQTLAETAEVPGQGYSINSQRNFSNSFIVDGLSANDDAAGVAGNAFSMEVVREFQAVTSGGQSEFGRAMGGYFNLVTRSGTNDLHGTAYGFLRNQRLNANNALSHGKLPLTQGIYGTSLGGPIRRNRTFAFGNFEEQRLNTNGIITISPANAAQINARLSAIGYSAPLLNVSNGPTTLYPTTLHTDTAFARADHRFSQNDSLNIRYSFYKLSSLNARGVGGLNASSNGTSVYDTNNSIAVGNIAMLSPRISNETRGQFVYDSLTAPPNDLIGPAVTISGVAIFGRSTSSPTGRLNYMYEAVDNLVMEHGSNTIKTGIDFLFNDDTITYPQSLRGSYSFSSLANFLAGTYNSQGFTQNFGIPTVQQNNPSIGLYVQDEWKVTPSLTLNAGLRYDLELLHTINTTYTNVSPRLGFAWSPYFNRRTVIRGSVGIYYDRIPLRPLANALLSAHNTTDPAQASLLSYTFSPNQAGAPTFPSVAAGPPIGAVLNYSLMSRNIHTPYSLQTSLGIEQQLTSKSTLGLSFQHLRGVHLIGAINTNINIDGTRPDTTRGNVKPYSSVYDSYYDGLEVSFVERPVSWGSARVSYTWSKAIDDIGEFFFSSPINNFNPGQDRSRSDDDQRHRVVFSASVNSPTKTSAGWTDRLTHGWQLGAILQYYSKLPFNITTGANTKQATSQRPCASGYSLTANGGLNPCTEALAGAVIGRNAGTGFDFFGLNARLSRTFPITERMSLAGIAEAFNALNHRNDMIPNATWGSGAYPANPNATFGQANAVGDPRNVQLAMRLNF
jgi:hypothetical protein